MRLFLCFGLVLAHGPTHAQPKPVIELSVVALPKNLPRPSSDHTIEIQLTRHGEVYLDPAQFIASPQALEALSAKPGLRRHTLAELALRLRNARDFHDLSARRKGEAGSTVIKGKFSSSEYSRLNVLLKVDRSTPEQHVQWVLAILAEQKYYRTWFAVTTPAGESMRMKAYMPADDSFSAKKAPATLAIRVVPRATAERPWGLDGQREQVTTAVAYQTGKRTANDLQDVQGWIKKATAEAKKGLVTEIWTKGTVSVQDFLRVLSLFRREGIARTGFYRNAFDTRGIRDLKSMPYPDDAKSAASEILQPTAAD